MARVKPDIGCHLHKRPLDAPGQRSSVRRLGATRRADVAHRSTAKLVAGRVAVAFVMLGAVPPVARAAVGGGGRSGPSLISLAVDGGEADGASFTPAISADGRYVAFASAASTLVSGDSNATEDVFVFDRVARTTDRVSLSAVGEQGHGHSYTPAISP